MKDRQQTLFVAGMILFVLLPTTLFDIYLYHGMVKDDTEVIHTNCIDTLYSIKAHDNDTVIQYINKIDSMELFINALIQVESRGRDSVIGDKHLPGNEAVGALQIRPIMVREVNRVLKRQDISKRFNLNDRFSRRKSIAMFNTWKSYHHSNSSFEKIARNWNGGPRGYMRKATQYYWKKVKKEFNI